MREHEVVVAAAAAGGGPARGGTIAPDLAVGGLPEHLPVARNKVGEFAARVGPPVLRPGPDAVGRGAEIDDVVGGIAVALVADVELDAVTARSEPAGADAVTPYLAGAAQAEDLIIA